MRQSKLLDFGYKMTSIKNDDSTKRCQFKYKWELNKMKLKPKPKNKNKSSISIDDKQQTLTQLLCEKYELKKYC